MTFLKAFIESDDEEPKKTKSKKKEDSDFEMDVSTQDDSIVSEGVSEEEMKTESEEEASPKKPKKKSKPVAKSVSTKSNGNTTIAGFASFVADDDDEDAVVYLHETLNWLKPDKIKDIDGNSPNDDNYDPTTLKVPEQVGFQKKNHCCKTSVYKSGLRLRLLLF